MRTAVVIALLALSLVAHAGSGSSVVIAYSSSAQAPAATLQMPADYVAIPITIRVDSNDPVKRSEEMESALRVVKDKLASHQELKIRQGVSSLMPQQKSKLSSLDSYAGSMQLYVLGSLNQDTNLFAVTRRIYQLVASIPDADGREIFLGEPALALDDPEKYRNQLLALIASSVASARKLLGAAGFVEIEGLENPVTVVQVNDREVSLFIDYRFRLQSKAP